MKSKFNELSILNFLTRSFESVKLEKFDDRSMIAIVIKNNGKFFFRKLAIWLNLPNIEDIYGMWISKFLLWKMAFFLSSLPHILWRKTQISPQLILIHANEIVCQTWKSRLIFLWFFNWIKIYSITNFISRQITNTLKYLLLCFLFSWFRCVFPCKMDFSS